MNQIFLAIVFIINGELGFIPGWYPIQMDSRSYCETARIRLEEQAQIMFENSDNSSVQGVYCGTAEEITNIINSKKT